MKPSPNRSGTEAAQGDGPPRPLDRERLAGAARALAAMDADLARILEKNGPPPLWARKPGFETLLRIILEQQVSLASAAVMYRRLQEHLGALTPGTVLAAGAPALRSIGITRQKTAYFLNLAAAVRDGGLDLDRLRRASDEDAIELLTSIKGIGPWTAKIYLLMALRRPDVWPDGDLALATAYRNLKGREKSPSQRELGDLALHWSPHRATAARMLWHYYLNGM